MFQYFTPDIIISGLLCLLLGAVILLALRLDRRLKTVRESSGELRTLIQGLNDATERAHQAVAQMSASAREHKATLNSSIAKARELSDELSLMTQSADSLANRLSGAAPTKNTPGQKVAAPNPAENIRSLSVAGKKDQPSDDEDTPLIGNEPRAQLKKILAGIR